MNFGVIRSARKVLLATASVSLMGFAACTTVTTTQIDTVAIGSPVWMKRTIRTDERTLIGARTIDLEVGYLYCEKNDADGPVCLPVDVKKIPRKMTHQVFEIEDGVGLPLKAHRDE